MVSVIVDLLGQFAFYRYTLYVFGRYVIQYTCESDCTIRINCPYIINEDLRLCKVKIRGIFVILCDSYNVINIELGRYIFVCHNV